MEEDDLFDSKCCEIYITRKRNMAFSCSLCETICDSFVSFLNHALELHYVVDEYDDDFLSTTIFRDGAYKQYEIQSNHEALPTTEVINLDKKQDILDTSPVATTQFNAEESLDHTDTSHNFEKAELKKLSQIAVGIYACDQCDRVYKNNRQLQMHHRSHDCADRKYKCEQCGFAFKDNGNLRHHIRRYHSQEKHYCCAECPKKFYGRSELEAHLRLHTGERPYICTTCGKTYRHLSTLNKHNMTHTGHRPFMCKLCDKGFKTARRFKEHAAVHTGQRTLSCNVCQLTFARADSLKTHLKLHANKKEYVCNLCETAFNQGSALHSHLKIKHKIVSLPLKCS